MFPVQPRRTATLTRRPVVWFLTTLLALSLVPVTASHRARATPHPFAGGNGWVDDDTITAQVHDGIPGGADARCTWNVVTGVDPVTGTRERAVTRVVDGTRETLYQRSCPDRRDSWYQWIKETTRARLVNHVSSTVSDRVKALVFRTAPPRDRAVVNVGTWFWVPRALWKPLSVTAYVTTPVGVISVTVTATPSRLRFDPGNGDDATWCDGPGEAWNPSTGDAAVSDCMYTYRHASDAEPNRRFTARTAVEWKVRAKSNFGFSLPLPNMRTTVTTPLTVNELQALLVP